jgi:hypothetical protein
MLRTLPSGARTKNRRTPPGLLLERVDDLVAALPCFLVSCLDVVHLDGNDRVFRCGRVMRDELEVSAGLRRCVAGYPAHVEFLMAQPEIT